MTNVDHRAQAKCRLGMAAYWFETFCMAPESNDHSPPTTRSVSTKWYWGSMALSSRGGMRGKVAKPINASAVVTARVLRHSW